MSTESSKETVRRLVDALVRGDLKEWDEVVAQHYTEHLPNMPGDREGLKRFFTELFGSAFPDATFRLDDLFGEEDKVAYRWSMSGTHSGVFMGIAPTGRFVHTSGIDIWRVEDGLLVEHWGMFDAVGLLEQIGAMPSPAAEAR